MARHELHLEQSPSVQMKSNYGQTLFIWHLLLLRIMVCLSPRDTYKPARLICDVFSGAVFSDQYLLYESYNQIMQYRAALRDDSGLWRHITMGNVVVQDTGHWATGNAWVVAGTLRVLQTIRRSTLASQFQGQQADLAGLAREIITATWNHQQPNGALLNYIDDTTSFADMSSTALMAASTFRLAYLTSDRANLSLADARLLAAARKARSLIIQSLDGDGWLTNVVDPQDWHQSGSHSPEGQAFVLLLEASYQDWMAAIPT